MLLATLRKKSIGWIWGNEKRGREGDAWHCDVNSFSVGWGETKRWREVGPRGAGAAPVVGGRVMERRGEHQNSSSLKRCEIGLKVHSQLP